MTNGANYPSTVLTMEQSANRAKAGLGDRIVKHQFVLLLSETGERMHAVGYERDLHNDPPSLRIYSRTILVAGERRIEPGSSTSEPSEGVGPPQLAGHCRERLEGIALAPIGY